MKIDTTKVRIGIGTSSPAELLHISGGGAPAIRLQDTTNANTYAIIDTGNNGQLRLKADVGQAIAGSFISFEVDASEAMRLDADGSLLVGKTAEDVSTVGVELRPSGKIHVRATEGPVIDIRRGSSSTSELIATFRDNNTGMIKLGESGNAGFIEGATGDTGLKFEGAHIRPRDNQADADNAVDLGSNSFRFDDIYATNGTIQTSDRNEKQDIAELSDAEQRVAVAAKGLMRKFRWRDAVAEKGDDARIHFGIMAQDLQAAFSAEGLDARDYAMFISTTWWETHTEVPAVEAQDEVLDEDGNVVTEAVEAKDAYIRADTYETLEEAPEGATERTRLGVRYSELLAFIIAAI